MLQNTYRHIAMVEIILCGVVILAVVGAAALSSGDVQDFGRREGDSRLIPPLLPTLVSAVVLLLGSSVAAVALAMIVVGVRDGDSEGIFWGLCASLVALGTFLLVFRRRRLHGA